VGERDFKPQAKAPAPMVTKAPSGPTIGKQTLNYGGGGNNFGRQSAGDVLTGENWDTVHRGVHQVWAAADMAKGAGVAWTYGMNFGRSFQDGNRPPQWLQKLLQAYNEVVSGQNGGWGELRACVTYMPAGEANRVIAAAVPRRKKVVPKKESVQIVPAEKGNKKPAEGLGMVLGATTPEEARRRVDEALVFKREIVGDAFQQRPHYDPYKQTHALTAVSKAKLPVAPVKALFQAWRRLEGAFSTPEQHAPVLAELRSALGAAKTAKLVSPAVAQRVTTWINSFDYKVRTPEEIQKGLANAASNEVARAQVIVYKLRVLHESLAKRDDWTVRPMFTVRTQHDHAIWLAGNKPHTVLADLEVAVRGNDVNAINAVLGREAWKWLLKSQFNGDPIKLADYLEEQNDAGIAQGQLLADVVSITPLGPFAKALVKVPVELLAYKTGKQSGWSTVLNIGIGVLSGPLDKYLRGSTPLRTAVMQGFRAAFEQGASNSVAILTSERTWNEKLTLLGEQWKAAVIAGFAAALAGPFKELTGNMNESMRKVWIDTLIELATQFGVKKPVEDEMKKFAPPPPKKGSW